MQRHSVARAKRRTAGFRSGAKRKDDEGAQQKNVFHLAESYTHRLFLVLTLHPVAEESLLVTGPSPRNATRPGFVFRGSAIGACCDDRKLLRIAPLFASAPAERRRGSSAR